MRNAILASVRESTFIELVLYQDLRQELLSCLAGRGKEVHSLIALIGVVAPRCQATPEQLREAIGLLEAEGRAAAQELLSELLMHPNIPEDILIHFAHEGKFVPTLGHRSGPRELLEILADRYRYPEAITTLALDYYGAPQAKLKPFQDFLQKYRDVEMLEYNLSNNTTLDQEKRKVVQQFFEISIENSSWRRRKPR